MKQRAVIKFNARIGKKASEALKLMQRFLEGRDNLEDDEYTGRPSSSRTPNVIQKVSSFVEENRCASLILMENALNINKETIRTILVRILCQICTTQLNQ